MTSRPYFSVNSFGLLMLTAVLSFTAHAGINVYEFETDAQNEQFYSLIDELRCPKCQNQNLADSNAPLAQDIKSRVHKLIREGKTDEEITQYLVERYGDFVSYRPPVRPSTWLLWYGPIILFFVVGLALVVRVIKRTRRASGSGSEDSPMQPTDTLQVSDSSTAVQEVLQKYAATPPDSTEK